MFPITKCSKQMFLHGWFSFWMFEDAEFVIIPPRSEFSQSSSNILLLTFFWTYERINGPFINIAKFMIHFKSYHSYCTGKNIGLILHLRKLSNMFCYTFINLLTFVSDITYYLILCKISYLTVFLLFPTQNSPVDWWAEFFCKNGPISFA